MDRVRSHAAGDITVDGPDDGGGDMATSSLGSDGRFKLNFRRDTNSLAAWCRRLEKGIKRPRGRQHSRRHVRPDHLYPPESSPRLSIAMLIVGSRGDVQPFIPIAQLLTAQPYGYRVRICTHPVFKDFVESHGVEFFSIGGDPGALMAYMVKNPGLLPHRESLRAGDVRRRREDMWEIINGAWRGCIEAGDGMGEPLRAAHVRVIDHLFLADAIIANPPSMAHIHCAEKLGIPLHMVFTMPWSPTESFPHPLAAMNYGGADAKMANYLSFVIMEFMTWEGLGDLINKFRQQKLGLDPISPMWGFQLLSRLQVPFTYLWSQSLIPKPPDWGSHINIVGFSFLRLANTYTPPPDLAAFLARGPPPIYVGFGSIVVDDSDALTRLIYKAVELAGVRAIVSRGWGGVGDTQEVPANVHLIGNCPHEWLFQHVAAVVHHGGAGTTAAGIAAGCPTAVVPFFGDQPFWGQMVDRAGAGPAPVPFKDLTAEALVASIAVCSEPETRVAAQRLAQTIASEHGAQGAARDFRAHLGVDDFACDVCPGRLAVWKHKWTGLRLSAFAACCLIDRGIIHFVDIKLLRRRCWYVDEGAENPLVGATAAFTCSIAAAAVATSDYARGLRNLPQKHLPHKDPQRRSPSPGSLPAAGAADGDHSSSSAGLRRVPSHRGVLRGVIPENTLSPREMEEAALEMARKSLQPTDLMAHKLRRHPTFYDKQRAAWRARERGSNGRAWYAARLTGRYAAELTKAGLKTPVALFYNIANGFHNYPSYGFAGVQVRRRDQITGVGSGLAMAGKELVLGLWDAVSGVVVQPYQAIKDEGARGTCKGLWRGAQGLVSNIGAAAFGLPGYTLKGIERECSKHHLTKLKAEAILIRMRQGVQDFRRATPQQKEEVRVRWSALTH